MEEKYQWNKYVETEHNNDIGRKNHYEKIDQCMEALTKCNLSKLHLLEQQYLFEEGKKDVSEEKKTCDLIWKCNVKRRNIKKFLCDKGTFNDGIIIDLLNELDSAFYDLCNKKATLQKLGLDLTEFEKALENSGKDNQNET